MQNFFANYGLIILLAILLIFMFWSSRRRMAKQKAEQAAKARQTVPGAEVLLQGGLYGTIVSYDPDNLDQPAIVELAPGVEIRVHSQAILRIVTPTEEPEVESTPLDDADVETDPHVESMERTADRLRDQSENASDDEDKPEA